MPQVEHAFIRRRMARQISSQWGSGMGFSQLLEGVSEQCRRHAILRQQRCRIVISLPLELLRVPGLHNGCRCRSKQIADIANVESPESSYRGTLQQQLQAVTPVRV